MFLGGSVKYIFIIFSVMFCIHLFANPMPAMLISELYVDDSSWWMELCPSANADSIRITNGDQTIQFQLTPESFTNGCILINSTQYSLNISPSGASIGSTVYYAENGQWFDYFSNFSFGAGYPNNCLPGQSLVFCDWYNYDGYYPLAVEASPTPGTHPFEVTTFGTLSGHVMDQFFVPVPNARVYGRDFGTSEGTLTDINGYFTLTNLPGMRQSILIITTDSYYSTQYSCVIPTQTIDQDFILENYTVPNQDPNIQQQLPRMISPNPLHVGNSLKFNLGNTNAQGFKLRLFNVRGEAVSELVTTQSVGDISLALPDDIAPGVYLYRLDSIDRTVAKGKITIIK